VWSMQGYLSMTLLNALKNRWRGTA